MRPNYCSGNSSNLLKTPEFDPCLPVGVRQAIALAKTEARQILSYRWLACSCK